jgi:nucleoid DNA-binding protein
MNKEQLTMLLAKHTGVSKAAAAKNLDSVTACIKHALSEDDEVKILGFGTWKKKHVPARSVTTPKGKRVNVASYYRVSFRVGKDLKKSANI